MIMEAIKKGFGVAGKAMGLVAILFVFNLIFNLAGIPLAAKPGTPPAPQFTIAAVIFSLLFVLISIFIQGGTLGLVRDHIKEGKMKLGNFASYGLKYYIKLLGLGVVIILLVGVVAIVAALLIAGTAPINNTIVTAIAITIALAIAVVVGLFYFVPFTLSPYAIICDEAGVVQSLKKCLSVVRHPVSRLFSLILLFVLLILISLGIGFVLGFVVGLISVVMPANVGQILMAVVTSAINGYLGVVMMAAFMTFYLEISKKTA
jgi:hypothetical protein